MYSFRRCFFRSFCEKFSLLKRTNYLGKCLIKHVCSSYRESSVFLSFCTVAFMPAGSNYRE